MTLINLKQLGKSESFPIQILHVHEHITHTYSLLRSLRAPKSTYIYKQKKLHVPLPVSKRFHFIQVRLGTKISRKSYQITHHTFLRLIVVSSGQDMDTYEFGSGSSPGFVVVSLFSSYISSSIFPCIPFPYFILHANTHIHLYIKPREIYESMDY